MTGARFTGSNSERQSVGLPGHCDDCANRGHVAAHPDLGCGDVGCTSAHDETADAAPTAPAKVDPIPDSVLLWDALMPDGRSASWTDANRFGGTAQVPNHLFHCIRDEYNYDRAPVGVLYTATGAYRLDDLLRQMWNHPDCDALRALPDGGPRFSEENLVVQERANDTLHRLWAEFRAEVAAP